MIRKSRSIVLCIAAPLVAACASGPMDAPSTDEHASAETATNPVTRESLARRARLPASGRAALAPRVNLTAFTKDQWAAALDLPPELVVSAAVTGQEVSATIFENGLGIIQPIRGTSFVGLSTGIPGAKEPDGPEPGTDFPPTDSTNSAEGDSVTLTLVIHVPPGANRMSLQYNFLSSEYPDFVNAPGTGFNDTFSVKIGDAPAVALASVNSSQFFAVSNTRGKDTGFDIFTANPADIDSDFGQGLPDAGLTDFQPFDVEVTPDTDLTIALAISDQGDGLLDSEVLIDNIQFSAIEVIDPNPGLISNGVLVTEAGRLATEGTHVRGAVADGQTDLVLRVKVETLGTARFAIAGDTPSADGSLRGVGVDAQQGRASVSLDTTRTTAGTYAIVLYRAPDDFARPGGADDHLAERTIHIDATFNLQDGSRFTSQIELRLRRPPVVFANGLWSRDLQWQALPITRDPAFTISYAARRYSCASEVRVDPGEKSFLSCPLTKAAAPGGRALCTPNPTDVIRPAIREALGNVRRLGIAATQVDMVAHGVAGIHARTYINSDDYASVLNPERNSVNRLITINTPHFGTKIADAIVRARDDGDESKVKTDDLLCHARINATAPVEPDTIDELTAARSTLASTKVPSHAIYGTGAQAVAALPLVNGASGTIMVQAKLFGIRFLYGDVDKKLFPSSQKLVSKKSAVLGTKEHDLFADIDSQRGGLGDSATTAMTIAAVMPPQDERDYADNDFFHVIANPAISTKITTLLNSRISDKVDNDPGKPLFANFLATPPALPGVAPATAAETRAPRLAADEHTLRIVSPLNGAPVIAGRTIAVQVVANNGFTPHTVAVSTDKTLATTTTAPFTLQLRIPADALGPIRLSAFGVGPGEGDDGEEEVVLSNDVVLIASTTATITAMSIVNQDPILFGAGTQRSLTVIGQYNDGVTREITSRDTDTVYLSSNPNVVAVDRDGTLTAIRSGITTVVAQNHGVQDSITVTVITNRRPRAGAAGGVELTCVAPGAQVPVQLDGSSSSDPDGDPLTFSWSEGGALIATGPTPSLALGAGVHTIDLAVSDGKGEVDHASVTISIVEDTAAPNLAVLGDSPRTSECGAPYSDPGATALDGCDGDVTAAIDATSNVNTDKPGSYSVDYRVRDQAGQVASASRAVIVQDTQPPNLTVVGTNPRTTECGTAFSDEGATANDVCDGDLTARISTASHVNTAVPGAYAVDYQVQDDTGLTAAARRAVAVRDTLAPTLTLLGGTTRTAECGLPFTDSGATATDVCDGSLTGAIVAQSNVHISDPGLYRIDYLVRDRAGLTSAASRVVTVRDTQAPVLTVLGANPRTIECGVPSPDPGATASDVCDGSLTSAIVTQSQVNDHAAGSYRIDYTVRDRTGLAATAGRAVTVRDTQAPALAVLGSNPAVTECAAHYVDAGATALDACNGDLTGAIAVRSRVNTRIPGPYAVDYQVRDQAGFLTRATRAVTVADRTPPRIDVQRMAELFPSDLSVERFDLSDCARATDTCSGVDIDRDGRIVAIHSDERDDSGRLDPDHDIRLLGHSSFALRQQTTGRNGRVYEIEFTVRDQRGNRSEVQSCFIGVKASRHSPTPINDGRIFTVRP